MSALQPFRGPTRKLVIAMDVGTTYSGVAYAILDPGEVPVIHGVTRFPGQENAAGDSKIPSVLYYRPDGTVDSVGAEASLPGMELEAEDNELVFVEWFKLHLRPESLNTREVNKSELPPLPAGKTVVDVFADFMRYLLACTKRYICETHATGDRLWSSMEGKIEFVLSHPNGWEGLQQTKMRRAAIIAGLVPDNNAGHARVHFVTEGEASLHYCIHSGLAAETIQAGRSVMIVDAGGGTVDISTYRFVSTGPLTVEETASADCILQGSTRVNVRAERFLKDRLKASAYGNPEDVKSMLEYFDKATKPIFKSVSEPAYIKFGSMGCNDPRVNIRRGQLLLSGTEMASFFDPSLKAIIAAVQRQRQAASHPVGHVFLVGGFAASPWLSTELESGLSSLGLEFSRPHTHTSKAVAEGGVSFFLEHFVAARVMKMTYGTDICAFYKETNPEHIARRDGAIMRPNGCLYLPFSFSSILAKGQRVQEKEEITSEQYQRTAHEKKTLNRASAEIMCYRGPDADPRWTDIDPEFYSTLCTVHADTSRVTKTPKYGPQGSYFEMTYNVILSCGLTEMQAQIAWMENGVQKRGPAKIVYDDAVEASR